jgi:hypothetical protein
MANNTGMVTSSVITATSQHKRDVAERIRRLYANLTKLLALVKGSNLDSFGKPAYSGKGMLPKKAVKRMDPEHFIYTPIDIMYLCTGGSGTTALIADTTGFQVDDIVINTRTAEVAIVNALTDGTTLTVTPVTGGTWSCNADDYIAMLASTFEEGTSRYANITNELTQVKTYLQIFREGISIADTVKNTPQYTNEGMFERYMTDKTMQALRKLESSVCFSKQATSGTTTVTIGTTAYPLYSMKGLLSWAGSAFNMNSGFNWETFNTVLYPIMPKTLSTDETVYMLCGRKIAAVMNQWAANSYLTMGSNADSDQRFGKKIKSYIMGGQLEVEPLVHDLFDVGGFQNDAIFFQNSDLEYLFMEGLDLTVRENAQLPSTMGKTDIIEGVVGLRSYSNGANVKWVSNLLAA